MNTRLTPDDEHEIREHWCFRPALRRIFDELDAERQDAKACHEQWKAAVKAKAELESQVEALSRKVQLADEALEWIRIHAGVRSSGLAREIYIRASEALREQS